MTELMIKFCGAEAKCELKAVICQRCNGAVRVSLTRPLPGHSCVTGVRTTGAGKCAASTREGFFFFLH